MLRTSYSLCNLFAPTSKCMNRTEMQDHSQEQSKGDQHLYGTKEHRNAQRLVDNTSKVVILLGGSME